MLINFVNLSVDVIKLSMGTARELQARIIDLINKITDVSQLEAIHVEVKSKLDLPQEDNSPQLPWQDAIVQMKESVSFEDLIKEQGEKSLTFDELRALADEMEWEGSLDEILEMLD